MVWWWLVTNASKPPRPCSILSGALLYLGVLHVQSPILTKTKVSFRSLGTYARLNADKGIAHRGEVCPSANHRDTTLFRRSFPGHARHLNAWTKDLVLQLFISSRSDP